MESKVPDDIAYAQNDASPHIVRMLEVTFIAWRG